VFLFEKIYRLKKEMNVLLNGFFKKKIKLGRVWLVASGIFYTCMLRRRLSSFFSPFDSLFLALALKVFSFYTLNNKYRVAVAIFFRLVLYCVVELTFPICNWQFF